MSNTLFVLLDGAEDDPNPEMGGRKPYEVAEMPYLESKAPHRLKTTGRGYTQLFLNEFFTGSHENISSSATAKNPNASADPTQRLALVQLSASGRAIRRAYIGESYTSVHHKAVSTMHAV